MRYIEKALGTFIEVNLPLLQTNIRKVARIMVSLNIKTSIRDHIDLIWGPNIRKQLLDYEGIPFRCRKFHEIGELEKNYPQSLPSIPTSSNF